MHEPNKVSSRGSREDWLKCQQKEDRVMRTNNKQELPIQLQGENILETDHFTYLGSIVNKDDMTIERNVLMKDAVPYLRDFCKKKDLDFQVIDMRWGVREDAGIEHTTTDICLREIKRCQETSAGPNFVAFLGDRYGSCQLPNTIPVTEFRTMRRLASWMDIKEFAIVDKWYLLDTNAVPPVYQIQAITSLLPYYSDKNPSNKHLCDQVIRSNHFLLFVMLLNTLKYLSISHQYLKSVPLERYTDWTMEGEIDQKAQKQLTHLKSNEVPECLPFSHIIQNTIPWTSTGVDEENNIHAAYLKDFCETFKHHMVAMIEKSLHTFASQDSEVAGMYKEVLHHLRFCALKCEIFCGRENELEEENIALPKILSFRRPVIINGPSGSGKTALMAKIVELSKKWVPKSMCVVRFLSTSASSSNIRDVLSSIVSQLWFLYDISPPAGLELKVDFNYLCRYLQALLWQIKSQERPLFLLLDSVDQLQTSDYAHSMSWMPRILPPNVHLFVSVATDHTVCWFNLKANIPFEKQFINLQSLDRAAADRMIRAMCHKKGRTLSISQRSLLLQTHGQCHQTLHLKLITDKALSWPSHRLACDLELGATVKEAIDQLFENLEKNHGQIIVSKALGYLTLADHGLTDGEMEDILSLDDEVLQDTYIYHLPPDSDVIRLPPSLWIRIKNDIHEYLTFEQTRKVKFSKWYHRHFKEAAIRRYITDKTRVQMHCAMAEYFLGTWSDQPKPLELYKGKKASYPNCLRGVPSQPLQQPGELRIFNQRKLQELPHHLTETENWEEFHRTIACSLEWLLASCQTITATVLLTQFRAMLQKSKDNKKEGMQVFVKDVQQVYNMIILGIDHIRRDPMNLPLQIIGQLSPSYKGSTGIEKLIQQCKEYLHISPQALMVPQNAHFPAPGGQLLSSINLRLFLMGEDRMLGPSICANEEKQLLHAIEWSLNGKPDSILTLDYANSCTIVAREKLSSFVHSLNYAGAEHRFLVMKIYEVKSKYNADFVYQLLEGSTLMPFTFDKLVSAMSVASHGLSIAFAYKQESNYFSFKIYKHQQFVLVGTTEEVISNGNVRKPALLWRLDDGTLASEIPNNSAWNTLQLTGDDLIICLACNTHDSVIRILSLGPRSKLFPTAAVIQELSDHNKPIFQLLPLHNGSLLISASTDNTIKEWDLEKILKDSISESSMKETIPAQDAKTTTDISMESLGKTSCIVVTRDEELAFFGTENGAVAFCKLEDRADHVITLVSNLPPVHLMCQTNSGDNIIVAADSTLAVFKSTNGDILYKIPAAMKSKVSCLAEGGGTAVAGHEGMQGIALVWNVVTGMKIRTLEFLYSFSKTAVSKCGSKVVVHMFEFPIVMDVITENSGHNEMQISMENMDIMMSGCTCMCVSPDDTLVAACATDGSIRVISMDNRYLHRMQKRSSAISATFSPDSRHLLTGGFRSIYMWNMGSGQLECKMTRHQDFVTSLTFAVDGHCLISTSLDMMIVVWDTATCLSLCTVRAHCQLHSVGLTPDLSYLVYMPERVASLAVLKPNMALKKCLLHGENKEVSRTLEQAQAFALAFSSQPIQTTTSSGCIAS
ncbi:hypothetical protein C0Q70_09327 [Pomacea canaliculata]|uniref:NACHT domain-containing protein n=1 Tax=Pomacea canaliculata TaxID=400727 RepID=A0A2T7P9I3_POMCA|nr:hypothetical protein C0Q70_09327 [Pomacea canaliculata]